MGSFILISYIALVASFFIVSSLVIFGIEKLVIFLFEQLKEYLYPLPVLPTEIKNRILQEAADFVHAKHRVGEDDYFHEYLWVANEKLSIKWEEMYGNN